VCLCVCVCIGPCDWCGTGFCCKSGWGDKSGGCDGTIGVPGKGHVCAAAPEVTEFVDTSKCQFKVFAYAVPVCAGSLRHVCAYAPMCVCVCVCVCVCGVFMYAFSRYSMVGLRLHTVAIRLHTCVHTLFLIHSRTHRIGLAGRKPATGMDDLAKGC
jgi:hypothetical protein